MRRALTWEPAPGEVPRQAVNAADGTCRARPSRPADPHQATPPFPGLLAGLRLALGTGAREADLASLHRVADWDALGDLAKRHHVSSLLLLGIPAASAARGQRAAAALSGPRRKSITRGLRQLATLSRVTDLLDGNGIPSLVLKGLPLSARLFGTPLARHCVDIDLLVSPAAVPAAERVLIGEGWRLLKPSFPPTPERTRNYDRFVKDRLFVGAGAPLELHHRLFNNPLLLDRAFDTLVANAATVQTGDRRFATLGDDDLLLYLAVHGQMHRWSRLKWLCDVAALLKTIDDHRLDAAIAHCRRQDLRLAPIFGPALLLARELLHVELPTAAQSVPLGGRVRRGARATRAIWSTPRGGRGYRGAARRLDQMRTLLAIKPSWRTLAHELARFTQAPYDYGRVDLPDRLFFLYLPLRPLLWLASWFGRARSRRRRRRCAPQPLAASGGSCTLWPTGNRQAAPQTARSSPTTPTALPPDSVPPLPPHPNKLEHKGRIGVLSLLERPAGNIGVELGVARGDFSRQLAESGRFERFFGVDAYADHHDVGEYKAALKQVGLGTGYTLLRMTFADALDLFEPDSLDFVHIDGYADTGQEGGETIYHWATKVRLGGVLSGHDYSPRFPLVVKAVDRFVRDSGFPLHVTTNPDGDDPYPTWALIKTATTPIEAPADLRRLCRKQARAFRRRIAVKHALRSLIARLAT